MDLTNTTPVPTTAIISDLEGSDWKYGLIIAKATYDIGQDGELSLDTQTPFPIFEEDVATELGVLPDDTLPRRDEVFEVAVLGVAYGRGASKCSVELAVGDHKQSMTVFGDRRWVEVGGNRAVSSPEYFERVPMTWDRAFGGRCPCRLDDDNTIEVYDPMNSPGRGFNAPKFAEDVGKAFNSPEGYPTIDYDWLLPNLEHPDHLITAPTDTPDPWCWSPVPTDIGFRGKPSVDYLEEHGEPMPQQEMLRRTWHRARPEWVIPIPAAGSQVEMKGMTPQGRLAFNLPALQVFADYELGERTGTRELVPHGMMLLPEEQKLYLVFRHFFTMDPDPETARSFRMRLQEGWFR